ncbi:esterase [Gammaproteobacteria bacterium 42_54_T18]|nr:esterase [Gammaproteobacteria bacterium 42_54_T18]
MDHITHPILRTGLRLMFKLPSTLPLPTPILRQAMEISAQLFKTRPEVQVENCLIGGVPAERISTGAAHKKIIIHLHGGAFFAGSAKTHRALASEISARTDFTCYVLNYRLAPEHPYPAALDDAMAAYRALIDQGTNPEDIIIGSDSGGCAHALSLAIALRDQQLPLPSGQFMISPFLDLSLSNPSVNKNKNRDPMVTAYALRRGADGYRGNLPAEDSRVSPLFADLEGLPPTLVQMGKDEILVDDALIFERLAKQAGMEIKNQIYDGMWHNFQMFNAMSKTAKKALDEIADFITLLDHSGSVSSQ